MKHCPKCRHELGDDAGAFSDRRAWRHESPPAFPDDDPFLPATAPAGGLFRGVAFGLLFMTFAALVVGLARLLAAGAAR